MTKFQAPSPPPYWRAPMNTGRQRSTETRSLFFFLSRNDENLRRRLIDEKLFKTSKKEFLFFLVPKVEGFSYLLDNLFHIAVFINFLDVRCILLKICSPTNRDEEYIAPSK